jgi:PilZ domain-containing protein
MRRYEGVDQHRIIATRIRPGHLARIVDVSAGGALIETMYRLLPGTSVELHVETQTRHTRVRGEVLRSSVVKLRADSVCYRGAIRFDRHLPWFVDESPAAGGTAESRPAHPMRASATPEVM